jgi:hypothetical protein
VNANMDSDGRVWKWAISPHPYDKTIDAMVTDDDQQALEAMRHAAESHLWDQHEGGTRKLEVSLVKNAEKQAKEGGK